MTDGEALLKAIIADPSEDTPRLVYSDWLEENGQMERAEYIRLAIEYVRLTDGFKRENLTGLDIYLDPQDCEQQSWKHEVWKMHSQLNRLLNMPQVFMETVKLIHDLSIDFRIEWWRGFPYRLKTTWERENWLNHHERLRELIPLEEVDITSYPSQGSATGRSLSGDGQRIRIDVQIEVLGITYADSAIELAGRSYDKILELFSGCFKRVPEWKKLQFRIVEDAGSFQTHSGD